MACADADGWGRGSASLARFLASGGTLVKVAVRLKVRVRGRGRVKYIVVIAEKAETSLE